MAAWSGSTRAQRLPADWYSRIRPRILRRDDHRCQIRLPGCTGVAEQVDHIDGTDDHSDANLQAACEWCNQQKNIQDRPLRRYHSTRRKPEPHPGLA